MEFLPLYSWRLLVRRLPAACLFLNSIFNFIPFRGERITGFFALLCEVIFDAVGN